MTSITKIKEDKLLRKKEISNLGPLETSGRESGRTTVKAGRKSYSKKYEKASKPSRRRNERASDGKKQRKDSRRPVFKLSDHLSAEIIEKLRVIKEEIENGNGEANRN